ncbi:Ribosomal lysine N-methyltransferase 2 [Nakaseomyces bracarensis]|uniref:Ribosomal lysine N-methyltransferase 2 n=1 Tax=Nakaseomyces bracarensis TaxID=273131 RepID=A0ABR4P0C8_9SACH
MVEKVETLLQWLRQSPEFKLNQHITVEDTEDSGRGVYLSTGKIGPNVPLISIPSCFQLNTLTVRYHLHLFNRNIKASGEERHFPYLEEIKENDPRKVAYGLLDDEYIRSLTSFQLISLYILAEWFLLPAWSNNNQSFKSFWKPFFDCWPTDDELALIPTKWYFSKDDQIRDLIKYLPRSSQKHVQRISDLIQNDWNVIEPIINKWIELIENDYWNTFSLDNLFHLFIRVYFTINSRCLYAEIPDKKDDIASRFTLVPYVDYLNHTTDVDVHCYPRINYNKQDYCGVGQFTIYSGTYRYQTVGEELYLNYGAHSNDFLFNEYGFQVPQNPWNHMDISTEVCDVLARSQETVEFLKNMDYWGDYSVSYENVSYRLTVALSHFTSKDDRRVQKLMEGFITEDFFSTKNNVILRDILTQKKLKIESELANLDTNINKLQEKLLYVRNIRALHNDELQIINSILISLQ